MIVKHFKDKENNIFGIDVHDDSNEDWKLEVKEGWVEITIEEALLITNPPLSQAELDQQHINELNAELDQLKQDMIFAQMMGDDISEMKDRVLEIRAELELLEL